MHTLTSVRMWSRAAALLGLAGCRATAPAAVPATTVEENAALVQRHPFAQIRDAWCDREGCTVLTPEGLRRADGTVVRDLPGGSWTGLEHHPDGWTLLGTGASGPCVAALPVGGDPGPCVPTPLPPVPTVESPPPIPEQLTRFRALWNAAIAAHGRLPFLPVLGTPEGGAIALARGGGGQGQLFRSGGVPRMVPVPTTSSPATWPAPFALHPSGTEAYLLSWPSPVLRAFDPFTLATRWTVSLEGAGQGLFVDGDGRHLLAATGPEVEDRWADWPLAWPPADAPCCSDAVVREAARPPQDHVVVVDLAAHHLVARAPGRYLRWFSDEGVAWLVTDRELVRISVGAPPA